MTVRAETYALVRPVPWLLQRGVSQTIAAPIRHGAEGDLVTVTEAGSTVTITQPDGSDLVAGAAVTVSSSTATYTVAPSASATLGSGWMVRWSLIIGGEPYLFRESAILCEWVPHCPISVLDLLTEYPELEAHVPQRQSVSRGDGTGWQPQVDQGYYALIRKLVDAGRPVWQLQEKSTGIREWVLTEALDRAVKAIPRKEGSTWEQNAKDLYFRRRAAEANLRLRYDDDTAGVRRGAEQPIRLAPVGRLTW